MPLTDAQKRAQKKYYEKNREKLAAYKSKYWQMNKHKWIGAKGAIPEVINKSVEATPPMC